MCLIPCPFHGIADSLFGEIEFREFCTDGVGALDANRRQYDLAASNLDLEILHLAEFIGNALRQGELILGSKLGEHCVSLKQGFLTLPAGLGIAAFVISGDLLPR